MSHRRPIRRPFRRRSGQAGFTMIEVMLSVLLTAITASGIVGLYIATTRSSGFSRHVTEATVLAEDEMERLRTSGATGGPITVTGLTETGAAGGIFSRTYQVTPQTGYDDMVVTIEWTEDGVLRDVILRSRRNQ